MHTILSQRVGKKPATRKDAEVRETEQ
jgi:hypothetical protein